MTSKMFSFIKRQYERGKIDADWLDTAVIANLITSDERDEIIGI